MARVLFFLLFVMNPAFAYGLDPQSKTSPANSDHSLIEDAQSSGAVVIDQDESHLTKGIRFNKDGTVVFKVSQGNGIQYKLNDNPIEFPNTLRWQFLGVRQGDVLTMTCDQYFEWMEYYYQDFKGVYIVLLGILASVLSIFINMVQIASHTRQTIPTEDEVYQKKLVDFILSFFALFYTSIGTFFQAVNIFSISLVINLFNVNLAPIKPKNKLKGFFVVTGFLCIAEIAYLLTGSYKIVLTMVQWNTFIGFVNLLYIFGYLAAYLLYRLGKIKKIDNVDVPYIAVVFVATALTLYAYFFRPEYVQLVSISYSLYFAYKSIVSLIHSERNKNKAEQQAIEIEEKNVALQDLNLNLENKVIEKTRDIQSLLDHIPQGVLSVDRECRVMKDYSKVLPSILNETEIARVPLKSILIDKVMNLTEDEKNQFYNAIHSIAGEYHLNFMVNESKLPSIICYKHKWLSCTYSAILDAEDTVEKINITLLDITKERASEAVAEYEKEKIIIVGELVNVKGQRALDFFQSSLQFIASIREMFRDNGSSNRSQRVMIALHTMKGAARTYSFRKLTNEIHNTEQYYVEVINAKESYDESRARHELNKLEEVLNLYIDINTNLLGRKFEGEKAAVDREMLKKAYTFMKGLLSRTDRQTSAFDEIRKFKDELMSQVCFPVKAVIAESVSEVSSIAGQLNKETPDITIEGDDIMVDETQKSAIMHSFLHIVRNSLDHGLETADDRLAKRKSSNGKILVQLRRLSEKRLEIVVSDDGRGLNLAAIRKKGFERGLIDDVDSNEKVANLIFQSGLSTAVEVTDISGRGVGMDAVRNFFEKAGGTVRIRLVGQKTESTDFYDFNTVIELPTSEAV